VGWVFLELVKLTLRSIVKVSPRKKLGNFIRNSFGKFAAGRMRRNCRPSLARERKFAASLPVEVVVCREKTETSKFRFSLIGVE